MMAMIYLLWGSRRGEGGGEAWMPIGEIPRHTYYGWMRLFDVFDREVESKYLRDLNP